MFVVLMCSSGLYSEDALSVEEDYQVFSLLPLLLWPPKTEHVHSHGKQCASSAAPAAVRQQAVSGCGRVATWFRAAARVSVQHPCTEERADAAAGSTHWQQQCSCVHEFQVGLTVRITFETIRLAAVQCNSVRLEGLLLSAHISDVASLLQR